MPMLYCHTARITGEKTDTQPARPVLATVTCALIDDGTADPVEGMNVATQSSNKHYTLAFPLAQWTDTDVPRVGYSVEITGERGFPKMMVEDVQTLGRIEYRLRCVTVEAEVVK